MENDAKPNSVNRSPEKCCQPGNLLPIDARKQFTRQFLLPRFERRELSSHCAQLVDRLVSSLLSRSKLPNTPLDFDNLCNPRQGRPLAWARQCLLQCSHSRT